jgi:protein-S-isoprenylcysteine O-methyltransferase Ste14
LERETVRVAAPPRPRQTNRKIVLAVSCLLGFSVFFVADSYWPDGSLVHESIEWVGIALISICVLGRTWCTLYIGKRKNHELIQDGPYSVVRHPLYVFSIIGAIGVGAQAGGFTAALVAGFLTWVVFLRMSQIEEGNMIDIFGARYFEYTMRVPRFMPNISLYRSRSSLEVFPRQILITFFDAALFFIAVPVMEVFDWLHDAHILPTLFYFP